MSELTWKNVEDEFTPKTFKKIFDEIDRVLDMKTTESPEYQNLLDILKKTNEKLKNDIKTEKDQKYNNLIAKEKQKEKIKTMENILLYIANRLRREECRLLRYRYVQPSIGQEEKNKIYDEIIAKNCMEGLVDIPVDERLKNPQNIVKKAETSTKQEIKAKKVEIEVKKAEKKKKTGINYFALFLAIVAFVLFFLFIVTITIITLSIIVGSICALWVAIGIIIYYRRVNHTLIKFMFSCIFGPFAFLLY